LHAGELAGFGNDAAADFGVPGSPKLSAKIAGAKSTVPVQTVDATLLQSFDSIMLF
jgi:hypothetical protein